MKTRIRNIGMIAMIIIFLAVAVWNSDLFTTTPTPTAITPIATTTSVVEIPTTITTPSITSTPSPVPGPHCKQAIANQMAFAQVDNEAFFVTDLQPLQVGECIPVGVKVISGNRSVAHALTPSQGVSSFRGESPLHQVTPAQMQEHLAQGHTPGDFLALELQDGTILYFSEHGVLNFQAPLKVVKIWTGNNSGAIRFSTPGGGSGLIDTARYWRGASIQSLTGQHAVQVSSLTVYIAPALLVHS